MSIINLNQCKENQDFDAFYRVFQNDKKRLFKNWLSEADIPNLELCYIIDNTKRLNDIIQKLFTFDKKLDRAVITTTLNEYLYDEIDKSTKAYKKSQEFPYIVHNKNQMPHYLTFQKNYLEGEEYPYYSYGDDVKEIVDNAIKNKNLVVFGELASGRRRLIYKALQDCFKKSENKRSDEIIDLTLSDALDEVIENYIDIIKGYHFHSRIIFLFKDIAYDENRKAILEAIRNMKINTVCIFIENQYFEEISKKKSSIIKEVFNDVVEIHLEGLSISHLSGESKPFKEAFNNLSKNLETFPLPIYAIMLRDQYELSSLSEVELKQEYCKQLYEQYKDSEFQEQILDIISEFDSNQALANTYLQMLFETIMSCGDDDAKLKLILKKLEEQHDMTEDTLLLDIKSYLYMKVKPAKEVFEKFRNKTGIDSEQVPLSTDLLQYVYLTLAIDLLPELNDESIEDVINIFKNIEVNNKVVFSKYIELYRLYFMISKQATHEKMESVQKHLLYTNESLGYPMKETEIWLVLE